MIAMVIFVVVVCWVLFGVTRLPGDHADTSGVMRKGRNARRSDPAICQADLNVTWSALDETQLIRLLTESGPRPE